MILYWLLGRVQYSPVLAEYRTLHSCTVHVWSLVVALSYLVGHEGKMGKVSIRRAGQGRTVTAGGVNIPHYQQPAASTNHSPTC